MEATMMHKAALEHMTIKVTTAGVLLAVVMSVALTWFKVTSAAEDVIELKEDVTEIQSEQRVEKMIDEQFKKDIGELKDGQKEHSGLLVEQKLLLNRIADKLNVETDD